MDLFCSIKLVAFNNPPYMGRLKIHEGDVMLDKLRLNARYTWQSAAVFASLPLADREIYSHRVLKPIPLTRYFESINHF